MRDEPFFRPEVSSVPSVSAFAPYRVSFVGGGTDLPEHFMRHEGAVVSTTLDIGITVNVQDSLTQAYEVQTSVGRNHCVGLSAIENPLLRETLLHLGVDRPLLISVSGNLAHGTGMGSSGALTVATILALSTHHGTPPDTRMLAETAYRIERERLNYHVGKQDQYASAWGGLNYFRFSGNDVEVNPLPLSNTALARLEDCLCLFATGGTRKAADILAGLSKQSASNFGALRRMRDLAEHVAKLFDQPQPDLMQLGEAMEENWLLKRDLAAGTSSAHIDHMHRLALDAGAWGAKLLGAGSAGFLCVLASPERQPAIRHALGAYSETALRLGLRGAHLQLKEQHK